MIFGRETLTYGSEAPCIDATIGAGLGDDYTGVAFNIHQRDEAGDNEPDSSHSPDLTRRAKEERSMSDMVLCEK